MTPNPYHETDPAIIEMRLIAALDDWPTYTRGQIVDWIYRMKMLPRASRHRLWVEMARRLPKNTFKYVKAWYKDSLTPDRRAPAREEVDPTISENDPGRGLK